ncbi:hypothetical protein [Streptomyces sp. NPDC051286]
MTGVARVREQVGAARMMFAALIPLDSAALDSGAVSKVVQREARCASDGC